MVGDLTNLDNTRVQPRCATTHNYLSLHIPSDFYQFRQTDRRECWKSHVDVPKLYNLNHSKMCANNRHLSQKKPIEVLGLFCQLLPSNLLVKGITYITKSRSNWKEIDSMLFFRSRFIDYYHFFSLNFINHENQISVSLHGNFDNLPLSTKYFRKLRQCSINQSFLNATFNK